MSVRKSFRAAATALALTGGAAAAFAQPAPIGVEAPESASPAVRRAAAWALATEDHGGRPFAIVDKVRARVFVFSPSGKLRGEAPVLVGLARGDESAPWIGERALSEIRPDERTTPAGRFPARLGRNLAGKEVLWVDYDTAVSLHPVINTVPSERRLQRLATPTAADNRISYGCINVPVAFFRDVVRPAFSGRGGMVYVLPEERPLWAVLPGLRRG
jgi:hypothetical protein